MSSTLIRLNHYSLRHGDINYSATMKIRASKVLLLLILVGLTYGCATSHHRGMIASDEESIRKQMDDRNTWFDPVNPFF